MILLHLPAHQTWIFSCLSPPHLLAREDPSSELRHRGLESGKYQSYSYCTLTPALYPGCRLCVDREHSRRFRKVLQWHAALARLCVSSAGAGSRTEALVQMGRRVAYF
ncbi:hypothetical protein DEU56DRAFT_779273 [Suillus clintonianus]|uniref:uncharacterized protein n=1 Tax=Suillus clintonianus TaxID=1904413 RepID=UPI001B868C58|nr:uncharacterized protein DEU56DRAFT_779273 [Suillus clintonianus]KAG2150947.1 hypothetical protein DEU56DRAFT_779273 [Suillus clintonianus]